MVLSVENLSKSFGKNMVFHDISFSVNKGGKVVYDLQRVIRGQRGHHKS